MIKISYAITVCNELEEIEYLLNILEKYKKEQDEIVVIFDNKNGTSEVWNFLEKLKINKPKLLNLYKFDFNNDFAEWKNRLAPLCTGDWIFNIDADEYPTEELMAVIHDVLDDHEHVDVMWIPRRNYVEGITDEYINQMGWVKDKLSRINYPDLQLRIWQNKPEIKWINKVHETLTGYKTYASFPPDLSYLALYHEKTFERQLKQNEFYKTLQ